MLCIRVTSIDCSICTFISLARPHEDLSDPGRLHVDPFGNLHICQGIVAGNVLRLPLLGVFKGFDPKSHPIIGPLIAGGPVELVGRYGLPHNELYADACHLCYEARKALRRRFPEFLGPDQAYGVRAQTHEHGSQIGSQASSSAHSTKDGRSHHNVRLIFRDFLSASASSLRSFL
jgi:hypothetical protein